MTRVIHTGDTHLGYQQYHRPERREDFLDAFRQVAADARGDGVDAVVHAGDLFHDRRPTLPDVLGALSVLRTLDDAGVPFLAVVGNHESKRDAQWLDLFESLGLATRLGADPTVVGDVAFYGLDFVPRSKRDGLTYAFEAHDAGHAVLVSHGLFQPFPHGDWDLDAVVSSAPVEFDAVLLGDDHTPRTSRLEAGTWATYCGSTERASADEREPRGYNLVTFDGDSASDVGAGVDVRRRGLDTREFVYVDVELGSGEGVARVRERVGQHDLDGAVVVVSITGDGEPVAPAAVEEFADDRGALVVRVTDRRELADEADVDVRFADPDEAVRERVRELGLSEAARELDETVRASKVADSNVADAVEQRVAELVESAPAAFETEEDRSGDADTVGGADANAGADGADRDAGEAGDGGEPGDDQVTMEDYT